MLCPVVRLEHSKKVRELLYRRILRAWRHNTKLEKILKNPDTPLVTEFNIPADEDFDALANIYAYNPSSLNGPGGYGVAIPIHVSTWYFWLIITTDRGLGVKCQINGGAWTDWLFWANQSALTDLQNRTAKFYSYYTASESDNLINALGDVWAGIPDNSCFHLLFVWKGQVSSLIGSKATAYYGQFTLEGYSEAMRLKYYIITGEWIRG